MNKIQINKFGVYSQLLLPSALRFVLKIFKVGSHHPRAESAAYKGVE